MAAQGYADAPVLSEAEAAKIVARLREAQAALRRGDKLWFHLLSGSAASSDMAEVGPRRAFLDLPLEKVWRVRRGPADNPLWRPYQVIVMPNAAGQLLWEVEVVLGSEDRIERVEMLYTPPAPF